MGAVNVATLSASAVAMPCKSSSSFEMFLLCHGSLYSFISMVKKEYLTHHSKTKDQSGRMYDNCSTGNWLSWIYTCLRLLILHCG